MRLGWMQIWLALHGQAQKRRRSPLADPLEGKEWQPFLWAIPLIVMMSAVPREGSRRTYRRMFYRPGRLNRYRSRGG